MKIHYDPEVDALYIRFIDGPVEVTTHRLTEDVAVNFASDQRVVGIEVLDASSYLRRADHVPTVQLENLRGEAA